MLSWWRSRSGFALCLTGICFLFGALCLVTGIGDLREKDEFSHRGCTVAGVVIQKHLRVAKSRGSDFEIDYRYWVHDRPFVVHGESISGTDWRTLDVGSAVPIRYIPGPVARSRVDLPVTLQKQHDTDVVAIIGGVFLLATGVIVIL
jgi:hypothetical protein